MPYGSSPQATLCSHRPSPAPSSKRIAQQPAASADQSILDRLTEREREVLQQLATGKSNAELAVHLYLGEGTIKTHVSNVLTKLGLRDRLQAVVFAYESGLVQPGHS